MNLNAQLKSNPSLFQLADHLQARLASVPGLTPFLSMCASLPGHNSVSAPVIPPGKHIDPVTHLWQFFRLGSSLCALFNALHPKTPLNVVVTNDVKTCKRSVYDFVQACKSELSYADDQLFTISNVFSDNTTDLLKVIHTVQLLLDTLQERHLIASTPQQKPQEPAAPTDKRAKVVEELLLTERKYVQDLEQLLTYQTRLQESGLLSADTIHYLFPNLNILIDFQRRFLVGIECHAQLPPDEQRIGSVFLTFQEGFEVYEGFALNQKKACEIAASESTKLMALSDILEPKYELPASLIKPIQRICKYPLLLRQLVKFTPTDAPNYIDQLDALNSMIQVTSKVNEQQRRVENISVVKELSERLVDWKGHNIDDFGQLLHDGVFPVIKNGAERDYHLYLFENIILCCKEVAPSKKPMTLSSKKAKAKRPNALILKGRIYIAYITNVSKYDTSGYYLHIAWGRDDATDTGFFDIRFRNSEQLEQWCSTITSMTERYDVDPSNESLEPTAVAMANAAAGANINNNHNIPSTTSSSTAFNGTSLDDPSDDEYMGPTNVLPMINSTAAKLQQQQHSNQYYNPDEEFSSKHKLQDSATSLSTLHSHQYQVPRSRSASVPVLQNPIHVTKPQHHSMHPTIRHNNNQSNYLSNQLHESASISSSTTSATISMPELPDSMTGSPHRGLAPKSSRGNLNGESPISATFGVLNGTNEKFSLSSSSSSTSSSSDSGTIVNGLSGNGTLASALSCALSAVINNKPEPKMKVKLHFLDDTFVLIVPFAITYGELLERVERKIRLCGKQTPSPLRIKYKDEDDDFVTMRSDDDIMMAIEPKLSELGPEYILQVQNIVKQSGGTQGPTLLGNKVDLLTVWAA